MKTFVRNIVALGLAWGLAAFPASAQVGGGAPYGWIAPGTVYSSSIAAGSAVSLTSGAAANITSIVLPPGVWECSGNVQTNPAGGTTTSLAKAGINTTSATLPTAPAGGYAQTGAAQAAGVAETLSLNPSTVTVSWASTSTVYLVANVTFAVSTMTGYGYVQCRLMSNVGG